MSESMSAEESVILYRIWKCIEMKIDDAALRILREEIIAPALQAAANRHCTATCRPSGYSDDDYHCRICPDRKAILSPLDKQP